MTKNNRLLIGMLLFFLVTLTIIKLCQNKSNQGSSALTASKQADIVLYLALTHPYFTEVGIGGQAFADKFKIPVLIKTGQEGTQANVAQNIESLFTLGYKAFSLYPLDPAGSKGLCSRLKNGDRFIVCFGAQPAEGTEVSFCIATDTRFAAMTATEHLIKTMGEKGNILNVLEGMGDANTPIRVAAIEDVVSKYPGVKIIQTIGDVTTEQKAQEKIESALVARGDEIDGVICTGYTTTVAAATLLSQNNSKKERKLIHFVGIDTDKRVIDAIRSGTIDATVAQNPYGHGYLTCMTLDLMLKGWKTVKPYQFIDSGAVVVTRKNVDTFAKEVIQNTERIEADIKAKYLIAPTNK